MEEKVFILLYGVFWGVVLYETYQCTKKTTNTPAFWVLLVLAILGSIWIKDI